MTNILSKLIRAWRRRREVMHMPLRLEFVVTDYCNLNCKGCGHYSPLAAKEFAPLAALEEDMKHLGKVCAHEIDSAYLIGGETLLYPDLVEAMRLLRKYFPTQKLYIFTNGLAIPKMSAEFWNVTSKLHFIMAITRYPIKFDYDSAIELCHRHGVETQVFADRSMKESFFRFGLDPAKKQNGALSHFRCYNRGCISVLDGKVFPCSISACIGHLNKAHSTTFTHVDGDYIPVNEVRDASDIRRLRDKPVPFCSYCRRPDTVPYGPSKRVVDEWVVE